MCVLQSEVHEILKKNKNYLECINECRLEVKNNNYYVNVLLISVKKYIQKNILSIRYFHSTLPLFLPPSFLRLAKPPPFRVIEMLS